jgi:two-component system NtrC family response regulator
MQDLFSMIRKISTTDAPVLIIGESGTGKELVARAIHRQGLRKDGPFIPINCSAIPENLIESELFGHEKGTFTGAHTQRKGRFEMAEGGTLFLDEIGELPSLLQVKLLRFLQEKTIERIGGRQQIEVDTRILAATNRNLEEAIKAGTFREDLYYRLNVIRINLPPLREREADIILLAKTFLERYSQENRKKIKSFSGKAIDAIQGYAWPGNVRELENRIKRAVIMSDDKKISLKDLEMEFLDIESERVTLKDAREELEKKLIIKAIARNENNLTKAAVELGVSRPTLYDLMDKLQIPR